MRKLVHVVPLGWEYDRVILPLKLMRAHRVHILCKPDSDPVRSHYLDKLISWLKKEHIQHEHHDVDSNSDLEGMLETISKITQTEQTEGNMVSINIASAGKVAAAACMLAAMAHLNPERGVLYYPVAERYAYEEADRLGHGLAVGMNGEPKEIPFFRLRIPEGDLRTALRLLSEAPEGRLSYGQCMERLRASGCKGYDISRVGRTGKRGTPRNLANVTLNRRVVKKLLESGFVVVDSIGQERFMQLTEEGQHMAMLCALGNQR